MEEIPMNEMRMTLYKNCVDGLCTVPPFWLVTARYTPLPLGLQAASCHLRQLEDFWQSEGNAAAF